MLLFKDYFPLILKVSTLLLLLLSIACKSATSVDSDSFTIEITSSDKEFMLGLVDLQQLEARVIDSDGKVVSNAEISWISKNSNVLSIDQNGIITTRSIGVAEVTASFDNLSASTMIEVVAPSGEGDFDFQSDNTRLRGSINLPVGSGPFPAVVIVHGSGTATRQTLQIFADILNEGGIAVLIYDKRGTGESEGDFFEVGPSESGEERIEQLGRDATAGLEFMRLHSQIDPEHVGLMGFSQGGWVNPSAAANSQNIDFIINVVGPVCTVGEEIYYSNLTTGGTSVENANSEVANFNGQHGYNPVPDLETIDIPGLWVLGGQDKSIPTQVTIDRLNILIEDGKQFDIDLKPNGNHFFIDVTTGARISYLTPEGGVIDWILEIVQ